MGLHKANEYTENEKTPGKTSECLLWLAAFLISASVDSLANVSTKTSTVPPPTVDVLFAHNSQSFHRLFLVSSQRQILE